MFGEQGILVKRQEKQHFLFFLELVLQRPSVFGEQGSNAVQRRRQEGKRAFSAVDGPFSLVHGVEERHISF